MRLTVCIAALFLTAAIVPLYMSRSSQPAGDTVVRQWLDDLCKGREGRQYWAHDASPVRLYAVQSYEVLDMVPPDLFMVRIHSSTREGLPIVRNYQIGVRSGSIYGMAADGEAEKTFEDVARKLMSK